MAAEASGGEAPIVLLDRAEGDGAFLSWLGSASEADPGLDISATSVALQLYTSGTTGKPKGAMLSHHSLNSVRLSQPASVAWTAWKADDVCLISMPLFRSEEHTSELKSLMRISY